MLIVIFLDVNKFCILKFLFDIIEFLGLYKFSKGLCLMSWWLFVEFL